MIMDELPLDYDAAQRLLLMYGSVKEAIQAYTAEKESDGNPSSDMK